ncbi:MAG: hypothetical protein WEG40_13970 [Candidatus Rokuibacteriota bacterium]
MKRLEVTGGDASARIEARFDPLDAGTDRGTRVDFTGGRLMERQEMFARTLAEYLRR